MKLSRVLTMIFGAALGTFAVVWWVRHLRTPAELGERDAGTSAWIQLI